MKGLHKCSVFLVAFIFIHQVTGHGYLQYPPNRSSLWRFDGISPQNYNDNQNFCGGFATQYYSNNGECGVCGDNYADLRPRANENTGIYGQGTVTAVYNAGEVIDVTVLLTANHKGTFTYSLCVLNDPTAPEPETCFQDITLADGSASYTVDPLDKTVTNSIKLPDGVTGEHVVLRWHYNTGNSWGVCADGSGAIGCGPQETFRSCADISIV